MGSGERHYYRYGRWQQVQPGCYLHSRTERDLPVPCLQGFREWRTPFSDVAATAYYAEAVKWATDNGITNGIGDNLFGSDNDCTRAQIVTFLYRMYQEN